MIICNIGAVIMNKTWVLNHQRNWIWYDLVMFVPNNLELNQQSLMSTWLRPGMTVCVPRIIVGIGIGTGIIGGMVAGMVWRMGLGANAVTI